MLDYEAISERALAWTYLRSSWMERLWVAGSLKWVPACSRRHGFRAVFRLKAYGRHMPRYCCFSGLAAWSAFLGTRGRGRHLTTALTSLHKIAVAPAFLLAWNACCASCPDVASCHFEGLVSKPAVSILMIRKLSIYASTVQESPEWRVSLKAWCVTQSASPRALTFQQKSQLRREHACHN